MMSQMFRDLVLMSSGTERTRPMMTASPMTRGQAMGVACRGSGLPDRAERLPAERFFRTATASLGTVID